MRVPLDHASTAFEHITTKQDAEKIYGHNNATYGPIPRDEQIMDVEFLEIAPIPIPVDRPFFVFLRGYIPPHEDQSPSNLDELLTAATLSITMSRVRPDGSSEEPRTYTVPLRTTAFADMAHVSIRDARGAHVEYLTRGRNDVLADFEIPTMFVKRGTWTFDFVARFADEKCLFAISLTQWLEGGMHE